MEKPCAGSTNLGMHEQRVSTKLRGYVLAIGLLITVTHRPQEWLTQVFIDHKTPPHLQGASGSSPTPTKASTKVQIQP
jgi:hypothetical protein